MSEGKAGQIGRYQVLGELGRGGFGCVYRAFDASVGRQVAIKVLTGGGADVLRRFRNEAQVAGNLRHENIVTVYEYGEHDGKPFLAMEYLEGEDLHQIITSHKPLTLLEKCSIMSQVAEGLDCAHRNGVVHRDIKPANIMVRPDGRVKIMDFGIARVTQDPDATRLTQEGWVVGTVLYMAPEQFSGAEVDKLCDIFAYGCVYYELLTGRHPFQAPDTRALMYKISFEDPPPIREFAPECPEALEQVILRILHKDRELRYQSLKDVQFDTQMLRMDLQKQRAGELLQEAQRLVAEEQFDAAQGVAVEALSLDPSNREARSLRETLQKRLQQRALQPRIEALMNAGEDCITHRHFTEAVQRFEAAIKLDDENPSIQSRLDHARSLLEHNKAALSLIADARKEFEKHNLTGAFRSISEALHHDNQNPVATELLSKIQKEIDRRDRERRIDEAIRHAEGLILIQSYDEAIDALTALGEDAKGTKVEHMLGWLRTEKAEQERKRKLQAETAAVTDLLRARKFADAVERLQVLCREFPNEQEPAHLLDYARKELEAEERARAIQEAADKASALTERNDFQAALTLLDEALQQYPGEATLIRMLGSTMAAKTQWERQQAIARTVRECGEMRGRQRFAEAIEVVEATLREYSGDPELSALLDELEQEWARKRRADAIRKAAEQASQLLDRKQFVEAQQYLRQMLIQYPDETGLATLLQRADEEVHAIEKARAIEAITKDSSALAAAEDFDAALAAIDEGLEAWQGERSLLELRKEIVRSQAQWARRKEIAESLERAAKLAQAQKFEQALGLLDEKLRKYTAEGELTQAHARIAREREEYKRREAIRAIASEARVLLSRGMPDEAAELLKDALAQYAGERELAVLADQAREAIRARERARAIENLIRESQALAAAQRYADARGVLEKGLASFPGEPALAREVASVKAAEEAWKREQAIARAIAEARRLAADRKFDAALELLARSAGNSAEANAARREIEQARDEHRRREAVSKGAADVRALLDAHRLDEANALLDRLSREFAREPEWEPLRGEWARRKEIAEASQRAAKLAQAQKFEQALALLEEKLRKYPAEGELTQAQTRITRDWEEYKRREAIRAIASEARVLLSRGMPDDAAELLKDALAQYAGERELDALADQAREAIRARERARAVENLLRESQALTAAQRYGDARGVLEKGLASFPGEAALARELASVKAAEDAWKREQAIARAIAEARKLAADRKFDEALELLARSAGNSAEANAARRQIEQARDEHRRREAVSKGAADVKALLDADRLDDAMGLLDTLSADYAGEPQWEPLRERVTQALAARRAAEERRRAIDAAVRECEVLARQNQFDRALERVEAALGQYPDDEGLLELRDRLSRAREDQRRAEEIAQAADAARALIQAGRLEDAIASLRQSMARYPGEASLRSLLSKTEQDLAAQQARQKAVQECHQLLDSGRHEEALRRAESALARFTGDAELTAVATQAREALETRRREEAIAALAENAIAVAKANDFDRALALLQRGLTNWPGQPRLLEVQRTLQSEQAAWKREQARRQVVQEIHQLTRKERFGEARRKAEAALQNFADDPELVKLRKDSRLREILAEAAAAAAQGRPKDALQMVEQSSSEYGSSPEWQALKKRLEDEVAVFERKAAVRKRADEARALAEKADFKSALSLLESGLRKWPGEAALEDARKAVIARKEEHDRQVAIENAAAACRRLAEEGRLQEAIEAADRYLREFPGEPVLQQLQERFQQQRKDEERRERRRADLGEMQSLEAKLVKAEPGRVAELRESMQQIQERHAGDQEVAAAAAALGRHFADIERARTALSGGNFAAAIELSSRYLGRYPAHSSFRAIHADAERGRRAADLDGIRRKVEAEPDLVRRAAILKEALARYPDDPWALGELRITSNKLGLVEEIVAQARAHEASAQWDEALDQWTKLAAIYDRYPGLAAEIDRVRTARQRAYDEAIARCTGRVEPLIRAGELGKARQLLDEGLQELPGAEPLIGLRRKLDDLQQKQRRIQDLVAGMKGVRERRNWEQVQANAAEALALCSDCPWLRKNVLAKLNECAREVLETDWRKAEEWLVMARSADPGFAPPEELVRGIAKKKRAAAIEAALEEAKQVQAAGKRREALAGLESALREYPAETRLEAARKALTEELQRERARIAAEIQDIRARCDAAADIAEFDGLGARLSAVSGEAAQDLELAQAAAETERAIAARRKQLGRARMWSAVGGKKGLAIAGATAVALAAAGFGIVKVFTPAHTVSVTITSDTPGATVSAGGSTCVTPNCTLELRPGSYTLTAQKDGYKEISQPLTIAAADRDVKVPLTFEALPPATSSQTAPPPPAPTPETEKQPETQQATPAVPATGVLEIAGALPQAAVSVDGRLAGVTDGRGRLRTEVAAGRHSIEISKDGYQPARFEARFTAGGAPMRPSSAQIAMAKLPPPPTPTPAPVPPPAAPKASEPKPVDTEAQDWARVANSGRIQDLQDYLRKHPGGAHERDAQGQIAQIQQAEAARADQAAWDGVDKGNKTALQEFISRHGNSVHLGEARNLLDGIQKREAAEAAAAELKKKTDQEKSTKAAEVQSIVRTLADYEAAFNRMDLPTMERLYNPMPAALREQFRGFKSVSFQLKPTDTPAVNGDTATVTCTRSQTAVAKQGGRFATPSERVQVKLVRTGSGWIIREITRM